MRKRSCKGSLPLACSRAYFHNEVTVIPALAVAHQFIELIGQRLPTRRVPATRFWPETRTPRRVFPGGVSLTLPSDGDSPVSLERIDDQCGVSVFWLISVLTFIADVLRVDQKLFHHRNALRSLRVFPACVYLFFLTPYRLAKRSIRPAVSRNFFVPGKERMTFGTNHADVFLRGTRVNDVLRAGSL